MCVCYGDFLAFLMILDGIIYTDICTLFSMIQKYFILSCYAIIFPERSYLIPRKCMKKINHCSSIKLLKLDFSEKFHNFYTNYEIWIIPRFNA